MSTRGRNDLRAFHILRKSQREVEGQPDSNAELRGISMREEFCQARVWTRNVDWFERRMLTFCVKVQLSA